MDTIVLVFIFINILISHEAVYFFQKRVKVQTAHRFAGYAVILHKSQTKREETIESLKLLLLRDLSSPG